MKIGIMSMQRIINYGSFLQAYGLSKTIKNLGHEVEFVDFKVEPCLVSPNENIDISFLPSKDKESMKKVREFYSYYKDNYLKCLNIKERNEKPHIDTLVIGSDEVFNCLQDNPDVGYSLELFGKDNNANKIISYAASCGSTTFEDLVSFNKNTEISNLLNNFDNISIRDFNSFEFVYQLTGKKPIKNLDPVLIYDFNNDIIDNVNIDNYIIVYAYNLRFNTSECEEIKKFAKKHNKKIISIGSYQHCTDEIIYAHPLEVLAYFKKADYIITDTFHGTIFSIITKRPFATFIRESNKQKLSDLLNTLFLSDRKVSDLSQLENILLNKIDYTNTNKIIAMEKENAIQYLKNNL